MNFGKNVSCLAASIAAVLGASSAYAVLPPNQGGPAQPDFTFYIGGGSAEPQPVQAAFCRLMTNVDSYTDTTVATTATDSGTWRILYGTTKAAIPGGHIAINKNVMVLYKLNGGSYTNGGLPQTVAPPNANAFLPYPDPVNAVLATAVIDGPAGNNGQACNSVNNGQPTQHYTKPAAAALLSQAPDFGLTDLEVAAFSGVNNPTNAALTPVGAATGIYDLVFGIAATNALYAQKHNFTSAELAAILSGNITDWSSLLGDQGAFAGVALPAGPIVIIDRNVGSGHKTQAAAQFLGYPGLGANALLPQSASNFTGTGAGGVSCTGAQVFNNSGYDSAQPAVAAGSCPTLPVQACDANYHDIYTSSAANTVVALETQQACSAPNNRAIGILSMDNPPSLNGNTYSFVSIDGKNVDSGAVGDTINGPPGGHTSYSNAIVGNYTDFYQANFNTRTGFLGGASANVDFAVAMRNQLASPGLSGCVSNVKYPLATPGILADSDAQSSYGAGIPIVSRNMSSDALIPTLTQLTGSLAGCTDPL